MFWSYHFKSTAKNCFRGGPGLFHHTLQHLPVPFPGDGHKHRWWVRKPASGCLRLFCGFTFCSASLGKALATGLLTTHPLTHYVPTQGIQNPPGTPRGAIVKFPCIPELLRGDSGASLSVDTPLSSCLFQTKRSQSCSKGGMQSS